MHLTSSAIAALKAAAGTENVFTDEMALSLNAYDCSLSRTRPDAVVQLPNEEAAAPLLRALSLYKIPFVPRASATNHAGGCAAMHGGVIINLNRLNKILEINTREGYAWAQAGVITADLQAALAPLGFFYAPDPASERVCTLGGNVAQNASGARCMKYGGTLDHLLALDLLLADGTPCYLDRSQQGPDLTAFLAGSEGTLALITRVKIRILPLAKHIKTFLVAFSSLEEAVQTVSDLVAAAITPRCVEAMDQVTAKAIEGFSHAGYPVNAQALLILELDGAPKEIEKQATLLEQLCHHNKCTSFTAARTEQEREKLWLGRRAAFAATARLAPNVLVGDGTVPRSELPAVVRKIQALLQEKQIIASLLFHAGDGNLHPHLVFDQRHALQTALMQKAMKEILQICLDHGGTLSGEHGIGVEKRALMARQYDAGTLSLFASIKAALDPHQLANPGKIIPVRFEEKAKEAPILDAAEQALCTQMQDRFTTKTPSVIIGNNTRLKTKDTAPLCTQKLNRILRIDKQNYTASAQAGIGLKELAAALKKENVFAAFTPDQGTLGGLFAAAKRTYFNQTVLGLKALLADGTPIQYGGHFVKNAAGYPLTKLFSGSAGQYGLITELTFKIFPAPPPLAPCALAPLQKTPLHEAVARALDPHALLCPLEDL